MIGEHSPVSMTVKVDSMACEWVEIVADRESVTLNCCEGAGEVLAVHQLYTKDNPELLGLFTRGHFDIVWDFDMLVSLLDSVDPTERPELTYRPWRFVQWEPEPTYKPDYQN